MNLVERVKGILLQPKSEWGAIEGEPGSAGYLIPNYVAIVAAIPAVCTFIGTSLIGMGGYRVGIGLGLARAMAVYVLSLIGVFVVAYIIDFLAGTFDARKSPDNAMRVSAYHRPPPGLPVCSTSFRRCPSSASSVCTASTFFTPALPVS